jgi:hypothetical protein
MEELRARIIEEVDYLYEAEAQRACYAAYENDPDIAIPLVLHATTKVLVSQWIDGKPCFPVMDGDKWRQAVKYKRCWCCGKPMGAYMAFVIGPMCGINRTSAEPPNDVNCAIYAAQACPFLTKPNMKRMDVSDVGAVEAPGIALKRNPGCCAVWVTRRYEVFQAGDGLLIRIGDPEQILWFAEGRPATREEVLHSIETGLPSLQKLAQEESPESEAELARRTKDFERWLPR